MKIGHVGACCGSPPVCKYCYKDHLSIQHNCVMTGFANNSSECKHYRTWSVESNNDGHLTGSQERPAIGRSSRSPGNLGPSIPVVSDPTLTTGIADATRNSENNKEKTGRGTSIYEQQSWSNMAISLSNAMVVKEGCDLRKKEHGKVKTSGSKITEYEKTSAKDNKPVV